MNKKNIEKTKLEKIREIIKYYESKRISVYAYGSGVVRLENEDKYTTWDKLFERISSK